MRLLSSFLLALASLSAAIAAETAADSTARVLPLAPAAFAGSSVNAVANSRSSLVTDGDTQYAAFYDADGALVLAKRALGSDTWTTRRTPHRAEVADAHNSISLAVDGAGFLHVAWGHHDSPLHYARSVAAGSIELAPPASMTGTHEDHVTYPQFFRLSGGDLLFLYRDGESGRGSLTLDRYSVSAQQWTVVQSALLDGEGRRSAYWSMTIDDAGALHLAWTWRESPDVATNHDLAYARSVDDGRHWLRADGTPLALPITAANADYAQRIPENRNLMNPPAIDTDRKGHPFICSYWSPAPGAPPQFQVVHYDGRAWTLIPGPPQTQPFTLAGAGTKHPPLSRAALLVDRTSASALRLVYRDDSRGGRVVLATRERPEPGPWTILALTADSVGAWEPVVDPVAWPRFSQAQFLVETVAQRDGDDHNASPAAAPLGELIWSPNSARFRHRDSTPAAASAPVAAAGLDAPLSADATLALARRLADWQWSHLPDPKTRAPRGWETAPFYLGTIALDRISPDRRYLDRLIAKADALGWEPGDRLYHADDHCVIQAYLELYALRHEPRMLLPSRQRLDDVLAHPSAARFDWNTPDSQDHWSWCDALFMGPMSWLLMWQETGDRRYLDFMNREWWRTTGRLYCPTTHLYFRDESFLDLREPNGKTIHWSRGNGWVYAGLARVLEHFPKDHPDYPRYVALYRDMTDAVLAAQQPDGLWRVGLLDPATHTAPETSGSSFFAFGLAWGVNHNLLDRARVEPAIRRAWNAVAACVTADGKLEHVQPIGSAPEGFDPHHTDLFAVGALLLAAAEVHDLAQ